MGLRQETPLAGVPHSYFAANMYVGPAGPAVPGAYVLIIETIKTVSLKVAGKTANLPAATYLYFGSAWGPGGLRARVGRHLKVGKSLRWHVDRLSAMGRISGVVTVPDGEECALFRRFSTAPGCTVPVTGFGSSDCGRCPAHLLRIDDYDAAKLGLNVRPTVDSTGVIGLTERN